MRRGARLDRIPRWLRVHGPLLALCAAMAWGPSPASAQLDVTWAHHAGVISAGPPCLFGLAGIAPSADGMGITGVGWVTASDACGGAPQAQPQILVVVDVLYYSPSAGGWLSCLNDLPFWEQIAAASDQSGGFKAVTTASCPHGKYVFVRTTGLVQDAAGVIHRGVMDGQTLYYR